MTVDEGYIKYVVDWTPAEPAFDEAVRELEASRKLLFRAGLIGRYAETGIGFGNISRRCGEPGEFLISGTQTGHLAATDARHYSLVTACDIDANTLSCTGPVKASSEAMTHAAIYALSGNIEAVVHVHSQDLWTRYVDVLPTTDQRVAYGTPQMAHEFARLYAETAFSETGLAVMAGHEEGLISIGTGVEAAARKILNLVRPREQESACSETSGTP